MCKMCNVEPLPPATAADFIEKPSRNIQLIDNTPQQQTVLNEGGEVSKWLRGHGFQRYA